MKRLDIEALRALCTVADQGGITRAAEVLSLSQSAVSHKIKRLEASIGCQLLTRRAGAPLLSDDGLQLLTYARRICVLHDEAVLSMSKMPLSGRIRLGMTEDITSSDLSRMLGRFTRRYPEVTVRTNVRQSLVLQRELETGKIDIGLMQLFAKDVQPSDTVLFRDSLHWVKGSDTEVNFNSPVPFLAYDDDCFYKNWALELAEVPAPGLETVLQCASSAGIASAVRAGLGVALLPGRYLTEEMQIIDDLFPETSELSYVLRVGENSRSTPVLSLAREISTGVSLHAVLQVA
ncbi:MAG: LysR family transcriptional regulator [Pseudomonadota bacterium]